MALAMNGAGNGRARPTVSSRVMNAMALIVTIVWGISYIADIAIPTYSPPSNIHFFPVAAVSALFGINLLGKGS